MGNWIRVLRLIWKNGRGGVLGILVSTAIDAVVPAIQVVLLGLTVNAVVGAERAGDLLIYPVLFGLLAMASLVLTTMQSYWQASLEQKVANAFNLKLMEKSAELSLPDFENPQVYNKLQLATREATSRPYQFFSQMIATVSGAISLVTVTGIVISWDPLVALLILLSPILPVIVNQFFVKRLWQVERGRSEERRRGQYLLALVTNDKTYKETRLFGLVPYFIATYRAMLGRFYSVDMGIERRRGIAGVVSGLVGVVVTSIAIYFAISDSIAAGNIGRLAAYISAISAVSSAAQMFIGGFGQLFEHTLFLGNLFDFLDLTPTDPQYSLPESGARTPKTNGATGAQGASQTEVAKEAEEAKAAKGAKVAKEAEAAKRTEAPEGTASKGSAHDSVPLVSVGIEQARSPMPSSHDTTGPQGAQPDEIVFEDVTFRYPGREEAALMNFSATFSPGRTIALVGENGAGKSTIVKLLARLYRPTSGRILLGDVDIQELDLDAYRSRLAVLFQDFLQYEASFRQNIGFGRLADMDDEEGILAAAKRAKLADVVEDLPRGIDTQLGKWFSDGLQLSGGQWQRVALARAFFRDAPVVVLDEPTASLDARAEQAVFEQMNAEASHATKILISHRFSTVRLADEILVIGQGRLLERGTHRSLVEAGGFYAQMYAVQARGYQDE